MSDRDELGTITQPHKPITPEPVVIDACSTVVTPEVIKKAILSAAIRFMDFNYTRGTYRWEVVSPSERHLFDEGGRLVAKIINIGAMNA